MIQLFLNGRPAIPTDKSSIKLTVENPYFTKSTSYTYDVELPLAIAENRKIFGFANRIDVEKDSRTFDARLWADNICVLAGTAHITSVDETSVKVQLLGSAASYNYGNKMDDTYIDELDMGDWYTTTWPDRSYWNSRAGEWAYYPEDVVFDGENSIVFARLYYDDNSGGSYHTQIERLFDGTLSWVAFPTINSTAEVLCNGFNYRFKSAGTNVLEPFYRGFTGKFAGSKDSIESGAIQPYIWMMAQKVAEATGFNLDKADNALYTNEFLRKIFIVNTNNLILCNKCLPHWTVNEWWTQLEQTFGVILSVNYETGKIKLLHRNDHYDSVAATKHLTEIVDEFSADVDDETQSDISVSNVGFADFDSSKAERLSEFILKTADIDRQFENLDDLAAWATEQGSDEMKSKKSVIFECGDGRHFIYTEAEGIIEVDMFRNRIVKEDSEDIEIELKFVPAQFAEDEAYIYRGAHLIRDPNVHIPTTSFEPIATISPVRVLSAPGIAEMAWYKDHDNTLDIEAIINEEEEEGSITDDTPDVIYIAIANFNMASINIDLTVSTGEHVNQVLQYPEAYLRERSHAALGGNPVKDDAPYSLSLIPIVGQQNLAENTIKNSVKIDTTVRHCIRFVSNSIPDPGDIFIIRNRKFVCEKIEADIASTGLKKLMTGYFFELR